jgi:predicted nucleic acid-binding protein
MPADPRAWARVVDASALGSVVFGEPEAEEVADRLEDVVLVAPALLRFELANICWKKIRRHPEKRDALVAGHDLLEQMEVHEVEVRFGEVLELAESEAITAYDASYLWLARSLDLELVTLDRGLARAAARERHDAGT